jgi:molecular chaperone HtpG
VVDSEDLPLNISRETIQENALVHKIASNLTTKVLGHLKKMADEEPDQYKAFWNEHGRLFKLGYHDWSNRDKFAPLLRFHSSQPYQPEALVSLDEYIGRVKPGQKEIYFASGPSREAVAQNPHLEIFRAKGLEVLYLFDPMDEFVLDSLRDYKEHALVSVEHADMKKLDEFPSEPAGDKQAPLSGEDTSEFPKFLDRIRDILGDRVTAVRETARLSESPCCLADPEGGMTSSMRKIMQIVGKDNTVPPKIMELNRDHRLVRNLFAVYKKNPQDDYLTTAIEQLFEAALLQDGYLKDPHAMVRRMQKVLDQSSGWYLKIQGQ